MDVPAFELLETMRWTPAEGVFLLDRHLRRIERSARYFDYAWNGAAVRSALDSAVAGKTGAQRLRLLVARDGAVRVECAPLAAAGRPARLGIAVAPIDPTDVFLVHKTTHRGVYTRAMLPDCDDVILWTPQGDVTETTIGNLVIERDGKKITPPADAGLLPGTFRAELVERGEIAEGRVTLDEVKAAPRIWIINSVREWWPAELYIANQAATAPTTASSANPAATNRTQR